MANIERLTKIADFLETIPPDSFEMTKWQARAYKPALTLWGIPLRRECGFAGCAIGWAAHANLIPGLKLHAGTVVYPADSLYPRYSFYAVAEALDIPLNDAHRMFDPHCYDYHPTTEVVARRMRAMIHNYEMAAKAQATFDELKAKSLNISDEQIKALNALGQ